MIITGIDVCPLTGATVDGGWPQGHEPQENLHTLIVVHTDSGATGFGSCFTSGKLIAGAVDLLWPLLKGELAIEPQRVSEKLHQSTFQVIYIKCCAINIWVFVTIFIKYRVV